MVGDRKPEVHAIRAVKCLINKIVSDTTRCKWRVKFVELHSRNSGFDVVMILVIFFKNMLSCFPRPTRQLDIRYVAKQEEYES